MTKAKKPSTKAPPKHLSAAMKHWWKQVERSCELEPHERHLLQLAAEAFDRAQEARAVLDRRGAVYSDRFEQPKARPEAAIERDARRDFAAIVRQLAIPEAPNATPPLVH
jgi:phage terminase small subunit